VNAITYNGTVAIAPDTDVRAAERIAARERDSSTYPFLIPKR